MTILTMNICNSSGPSELLYMPFFVMGYGRTMISVLIRAVDDMGKGRDRNREEVSGILLDDSGLSGKVSRTRKETKVGPEKK